MIPSFISQDLHQNCRGVSGRLPGPGFAIPVLGAKHLLALLVCALALAGCTGEKAEPPTRTVETVVVGEASDSLSSVYSGQVVARYSSNHAFRVPGMITERLVDVGQPVVAGQILARIDPRDLLVNVSGAQAQTSSAATQADTQARDLVRARRLLAEGFISQAEFDRQSAALAAAQGQLRASQAQLRGVNQQLGYSVLRASRSGVVTAVSGDAGEVVAAGQPVVVIASPDQLEVAISIPEGDVARFRAAGLAVRFWAAPTQSYPAHIRTLSLAANPQTRTFDARIVFDAPAGAAAIGNTAEVLVSEPLARQAFRVPLTAITQSQGSSIVWVVSGNPASVSMRRITLGGVQGTDALVTSGLNPGDRVISAGAHLLRQGQRVTPVRSTAETDR